MYVLCFAEGIEIGIEKGRAEGIKEERLRSEKAMKEERLRSARAMKQLGVDVQTIAKGFGLTPEEIADLA